MPSFWAKYFRTTVKYAAVTGAIGGVALLGPVSVIAMRESPKNAASCRRNGFDNVDGTTVKVLPKNAVKELKENGIVVIDNVLTAEQLSSAREDLEIMLKNSEFSPTDQDSTEVRTDNVCWISESIGAADQKSTLRDGMRQALGLVRSIPLELIEGGILSKSADADTDGGGDGNNLSTMMLGVPFSNQLACYSSVNAHYIPHRDTPGKEEGHPLQSLLQPGLEDRKITIILYLNDPKWDSGAESKLGVAGTQGNLRCYLGADAADDTGETASKVLDIAPHGGRLVIFDATTVLHEVLPCPQQRAAITCWVGGKHSKFYSIRKYCIPREEMK